MEGAGMKLSSAWKVALLVIGVITLGLVFANLLVTSNWTTSETKRVDSSGLCDDHNPATRNLIVGSIGSATRHCEYPLLPEEAACESDVCYVDGSCTVIGGKPTGVSTGECPGIGYSIYPPECPIPIFLSDIQTDILNTNLYYFRDCELGKCNTYIMYPRTDSGLLLGLPPMGSEFVDIFLTVTDAPDLEKKCLNQISDSDPMKYCYTARPYIMFSSIFNDYLHFCGYSHSNAQARFLLDNFDTDVNLLPLALGGLTIQTKSMGPLKLKPTARPTGIHIAQGIKDEEISRNDNVFKPKVSHKNLFMQDLERIKLQKEQVRKEQQELNENDNTETEEEGTFVSREITNDIHKVVLQKEKVVKPKTMVKESDHLITSKPNTHIKPRFKFDKKTGKSNIKDVRKAIKAKFIPQKRSVEDDSDESHQGRDYLDELARRRKEKSTKNITRLTSSSNSKLNKLHTAEVFLTMARNNVPEDIVQEFLESNPEIVNIFGLTSANPLKMNDIVLNATSTPEFIIDSFFEGEGYVNDFNGWLVEAAELEELTALDVYFGFASFYGALDKNYYLGFMVDFYLSWWW